MGHDNMDTYRVGFKTFESVHDMKSSTDNFEKGSTLVKVKSTANSNSGTAKRQFMRDLPKKVRDRTVVTSVSL